LDVSDQLGYVAVLSGVLKLEMWLKIVRAVVLSDVVISTLLILLVTGSMSMGVFFLSWLIYNERHGISLADYSRLVFL
jgi:hypothetical protein